MKTFPLLRRLARSDRGAALVEFAIALPILVMLFAVIIEGGRMMWSYQTAVAGVRDAARYVGRVVPSNVCATATTVPISTYVTNATLANIVSQSIDGDGRTDSPSPITPTTCSMQNRDPNDTLPPRVCIDPNGTTPPVNATLTCVEGTSVAFRIPRTPVVTVSARVRIEFPFEGLFDITGGGFSPFLVTTISDRSRVFGS